jgi:DNA-binding transcriptional regulator YiaG
MIVVDAGAIVTAAGGFVPGAYERAVKDFTRVAGWSEPTSASLKPDPIDSASFATNAGVAIEVETAAAGASIGELRRLSGLTWDQLAYLFDVSRRTMHFWASGKPQNAEHEAHLHRVRGVMRKLDRGSASENRALLLSVTDEGAPLDLLQSQRYDDVERLLGVGQRRVRPVRKPLSKAAQEARKPLPVEVLLNTAPDTPGPTSGRLLGSFPVKRKQLGE